MCILFLALKALRKFVASKNKKQQQQKNLDPIYTGHK